MTNPKKIDETLVLDCDGRKRSVKPGNIVGLIPPSGKQETDDDYFISRDYGFLRKWLGNGPFEISWIGQWPCGTVMLYLKTQDGEPGVHASDMKYVSRVC